MKVTSMKASRVRNRTKKHEVTAVSAMAEVNKPGTVTMRVMIDNRELQMNMSLEEADGISKILQAAITTATQATATSPLLPESNA